MIQTFVICGAMIIGAILYILVWVAWDRCKTRTRLDQNQKAWDEYSKGMTDSEKWDSYELFCEEQKTKNGWEFYYFPKM